MDTVDAWWAAYRKYEQAKEIWSIVKFLCNIKITDEKLIQTHPEHQHHSSYKVDVWMQKKRSRKISLSKTGIQCLARINKIDRIQI